LKNINDNKISKKMQNKGSITFVAIILVIISIFYLSFTWVTRSIENDAREFAAGDTKLEENYLDSLSSEIVYNLGIIDYTYRECKEHEINLGLDLKGGMNVTLEISVIDVIRALANHSTDTSFTNAIKLAKTKQQGSQEDFVTLFGQAFSELNPDGRLAAIFSTLELKDRISYESTNEEVLEIISEETEGAISNSYNILRSRIDRFGVVQPNIQKLETSGRVLVELPGIKEPERVRKLLQGTASLEFWETFENAEVFNYLSDANKRIREMQIGSDEDGSEIDSTLQNEDNEVISDVEPTKELPEENLLEETDSLSADSSDESLLEMLENDSTLTDDELTQTREQFNKENPLFAVLTPNITKDNKYVEGASVGFSHFKDTSKVNDYLNLKQVQQLFPRDLKFFWTIKHAQWDKSETYFELIAIKITTRDQQAPLSGEVVTSARAEFGQTQANAEVSMTMNGEGAKVWARMTKDNVGKQIAIVLDNYVYSYPRVNQEITGGRSSITGNFTIAEAQDLANILKSGKMPAPARILEEAIVGPSLGQQAINSGLISFIFAFILVLIYMVFYYNRAGWVANIALFANVFFIMGVLASLGAVLTLPGIAGIVLTIGISVDANVLIYERIREEISAGKGIRLAVKEGYQKAYSAIVDANVTTLLVAIILGYFGKGPIQGFATTLGIGVLTSLFSAIFITRIIFESLLGKDKKIKFSTKFTENAFKNLQIQFLDKRKTYYMVSGTIIIVAIISLAIRGLNYGVDFKGGRTYQVAFEQSVNTVDIQSALAEVYGDAPEVKIFGSDNQVKISTKYMIDSEDPDADDIVEEKLYEGLKPILGEDVSYSDFINNHRMQSQKVGPTIADDIKVSAVFAIIFSLIVIFLYILIRFRNWQFGLGALAALVHDVLFVLGIFSLLYGLLPFSLEIDQAFIAAILTVVGYSINDTVVVFDRIRERVILHPKRERDFVYNNALNSTISRTFSTSISTFIVVLTVFIFGGEVIRGFVFALMIGIIVGTYSSLFIATPIAFDTMKKKILPTDNKSIKKKKK